MNINFVYRNKNVDELNKKLSKVLWIFFFLFE